MPFLLKKILLIIACRAYALVSGKARTVPGEPRRIAVLQMAKLGDMVCTTPVFRAIKEKYPHARLTVVGNRINEKLLEHNADVDKYLPFPGLFALARALRKEKPDVIVIPGPDIASLSAALLSGTACIIAPRVVHGVSPLTDTWYRALLPLVIERPHRMGAYAPREYLQLLEPLGIHTDITKKHLGYSPQAETCVQEFIRKNQLRSGTSLVAVAPAAGNKVKEWPEERFALVLQALSESGARVILIGTAADQGRAAKIIERAGLGDQVINACGTFSLDESKALIDAVDLLLGVDTGPIYIAEAFGTPTVDIVGPMDEREQPPIGERHIALVPPPPREPQLHIMNAHPKDEREARRQVEAITVEVVIDACLGLLRCG